MALVTSRRPVGPVEKKPARKLQRPDGPVFTDLTEKELAFRELIAGEVTSSGRVEISPRYALECRAARARWEAEHPEHCAAVRRRRALVSDAPPEVTLPPPRSGSAS